MNAKISQLLPFQEISIFNTGTCSYLGWRDGLLHKILHRGQTKDPLSPILFNLVTIVLMHFFVLYIQVKILYVLFIMGKFRLPFIDRDLLHRGDF
jgi:hypothetical protein